MGSCRNCNSDFCVINGLLYKGAPAHIITALERVLVLPGPYIQEVKKVGRPFRCEKTSDRLSALYYFPKMRDLVKLYVRCCKQCQIVAPKRLREATSATN